MLEFTVFIKVRIPNLNDTEREISLIVSNEVIIKKIFKFFIKTIFFNNILKKT